MSRSAISIHLDPSFQSKEGLMIDIVDYNKLLSQQNLKLKRLKGICELKN